jgi:tRNA nucleotidyltransferase (CCA-adding enzyme)
MRRDLTINSLFYNIHDCRVEDHTGMRCNLLQISRMLKIRIEGLGLHDLLHHSERPFIRTPLSAEVTFRDDPLRLLRSIRFASRFESTIHEEIFAAARNTVIRVSRSHHVSPKYVDIVCTIGSADDEDQP